ncbi:MAG: hypothetical protein QM784_18805 [Polyangiaceae bacterium]
MPNFEFASRSANSSAEVAIPKRFLESAFLLRRWGTTYTAEPDLALYDPMRTAYAGRL